MSPESIRDQIDAFLAYAAKPGARDFEAWMESKGFTKRERRALEQELRERVEKSA